MADTMITKEDWHNVEDISRWTGREYTLICSPSGRVTLRCKGDDGLFHSQFTLGRWQMSAVLNVMWHVAYRAKVRYPRSEEADHA